MNKNMTPAELNDLLNSVRHQKFRKKHQSRLDVANYTMNNNAILYDIGTYVLRSPGNDLLDFYDSMSLRLDPDSKCACPIPPSVVFDMRYRLEIPDYILENHYNYGINAYLQHRYRNFYDTQDRSWYKQKYKQTYKWLVDEPHKEYRFSNRRRLDEFIKNKLKITMHHHINLNNYITNNTGKKLYAEEMTWRGSGAGWSIVCEVKPSYKHIHKIEKLEKMQYPDVNPTLTPEQLLKRAGYGSANR